MHITRDPYRSQYTLKDVYHAAKTEREFNHAFWLEVVLGILFRSCVNSTGKFLVFLTWTLIVFFVSTGFFVIIPVVAEPWTPWFIFNICWGMFLMISIVFHYYMGVTSDPGYNVLDDSRQRSETNLGHCKKCNSAKPFRTHHCSICKRCVSKMDHHCPWLNNCVGRKNYRYFLSFLLWVSITTLYIVILTTPIVLSKGSIIFMNDRDFRAALGWQSWDDVSTTTVDNDNRLSLSEATSGLWTIFKESQHKNDNNNNVYNSYNHSEINSLTLKDVMNKKMNMKMKEREKEKFESQSNEIENENDNKSNNRNKKKNNKDKNNLDNVSSETQRDDDDDDDDNNTNNNTNNIISNNNIINNSNNKSGVVFTVSLGEAVCMLTCLTALGAFIGVGSLLTFHCYIVATGQTTLEFSKQNNKEKCCNKHSSNRPSSSTASSSCLSSLSSSLASLLSQSQSVYNTGSISANIRHVTSPYSNILVAVMPFTFLHPASAIPDGISMEALLSREHEQEQQHFHTHENEDNANNNSYGISHDRTIDSIADEMI